MQAVSGISLDSRIRGQNLKPTSVNAFLMDFSFVPMSKASTFPVSITRGMTLAAIKTAMNRDAIGSKPVHP